MLGQVPEARHVRDAAKRLRDRVARTPIMSATGLDNAVGRRVVCKAELFQPPGSFKARGALNHIALFDPAQRARGVICASSGNHARALAWAAHLLGAPATVVIPADTPTPKRQGALALGAHVVTYERGRDDRDAMVATLAERHDLRVVPSADSPAVIAGAGTVALEFLEDVPELAALVLPVGGGGLAAGCALIAKHLNPRIRVIGVEPTGGDDTRRSLAAGRPISLEQPPDTIADGLTHQTPAALPFRLNAQLLDEVVTVTDAAIIEAMALLWQHLRLMAEPSGAIALAAVLTSLPPTPGVTGVVISGGGISWPRFQDLIQQP